jgi:molybdate transport system substrate-binding protein
MRARLRRLATMIAGCSLPMLVSAHATSANEAPRVYAAGSLRAPMAEIGQLYLKQTGVAVRHTFGASGLLKERIEKGETADVFASANMDHPAALVKTGLAQSVRVFARNEMCALVAPKLAVVTTENLLTAMLDPAVKLGTSTPKADPSGDYAFEVFDKAAAVAGPAARDTLKKKALQLTGGRDSPPPPVDRSVYAELVAKGQADLFLTYCTNAALAIKEQPQLRRVALPAALAVSAEYGVAVLQRASHAGARYANYLMQEEAQAVLARYGFAAAKVDAAKSDAAKSDDAKSASAPGGAITVELPGKVSRTLSMPDLEKLERKTASIKIKDKGPFTFSGVSVFSVLQAAGYELDQPPRAYLTQYVVLKARDGYRVVYSMGEFDPKSRREAPLLVSQRDGVQLKGDEGPWRLVIPDNVHTSRWIRQVEKITVLQAE